jgi:hypothetical protein
LIKSWGLQFYAAYDKPVKLDLLTALHSQDFTWKFRNGYTSPYIDESTDSMGRSESDALSGGNSNRLNYVNLPFTDNNGMDISDSDASNDDENNARNLTIGMPNLLDILFQGPNGEMPQISIPSSDESEDFDEDNPMVTDDSDTIGGPITSQLVFSPTSSDDSREVIRLPQVENQTAEMLGRGPDGRSLRLRTRNPRLSFEAVPSSAQYIEPPPRHILPYLGTLSGGRPAYKTSNELSSACMYDLSHMTPSSWHLPGLVMLPKMFTELYARVKSPYTALSFADFDPAVCLICGGVVAAGHYRAESEARRATCGGCTMHARSCGAGMGVFFLVHRCIVLLLRDGKAAYWGSLYLDEHGEEDIGLRRGRPLYLSTRRCSLLCTMYIQHRVAQEVTTVRSNADRVIREDFY